MEFQRNSLVLSLPTVVLHMCSSLGADCNALPRDAAFASATINRWEKTFLELGSFPATPFPKSTRNWPANGVLTDPLVITANSPKQGFSLRRNHSLHTCWLWLLCVSKNPDPVLTHGFYNRVTASAPLALVHMPRSLTEKRCSLIPYSQTVKSQSSGIKLNSTKSRKVQGYNMWSSKSINTESDSRFSADEKKLMLCFSLAPKQKEKEVLEFLRKTLKLIRVPEGSLKGRIFWIKENNFLWISILNDLLPVKSAFTHLCFSSNPAA